MEKGSQMACVKDIMISEKFVGHCWIISFIQNLLLPFHKILSEFPRLPATAFPSYGAEVPVTLLSKHRWPFINIQPIVTLMTSWILVSIGSGSGLLPDGNKPLSLPMLISL